MPSRRVQGSNRLDKGILLACCMLCLMALFLPDRVRERVANGVRRTVLSPLVGLQKRAEMMRSAVLDRDSELELRGDAITRSSSAASLQAENEVLRRTLGLAGRLKDGFVVAEAFHPVGLTDDFTLTIAAGERAGVETFLPVVTADGLVGMVESVDRDMSRAITWSHPDFSVSAMSENESAFGIVQPHLVDGPERYLLEMRGVPFRERLDSGTVIVSSGMGATYPRGIVIGTVIAEVPTTERWARTFLVRPAVLPSSLSAVVVLLKDKVNTGVASVWTDLPSADSAARAIVAASDSIARLNALAELRARRAALEAAAADSARLDSVLAPLGPAPVVAPPIMSSPVRPGLIPDSSTSNPSQNPRED